MVLTRSMATAAGEVKLLGAWGSPYVVRPRVALNVKSVDYQFLEEPWGAKSKLLLKSNPVHKKLPVLLHRDRPICESLIILQYIDETWPDGPSILPSDPYDRAIARFWAAYIDDKWFPAMTGTIRATTEEGRAEAMRQVREGEKLLEEAFVMCSKGKSFFGGDSVGYLDIVLGSYLAGIKASDQVFGFNFLNADEVPNLAEWAGRFPAAASVVEAMPEVERLVEFFKNLQARPTSYI